MNHARLEGTYLFPLPTGAQIDKFFMEINGQLAEAALMSADKARRIYEWIAARVQKMPNAPRVRVHLGSVEYFALLAKHPEALAWAALGRNVQFRLGESVCEVYE